MESTCLPTVRTHVMWLTGVKLCVNHFRKLNVDQNIAVDALRDFSMKREMKSIVNKVSVSKPR